MSGSYLPLLATGDILLFRRKHGATSILVALNLGSQPGAIEVEQVRRCSPPTAIGPMNIAGAGSTCARTKV
jgi:hypothetical protein